MPGDPDWIIQCYRSSLSYLMCAVWPDRFAYGVEADRYIDERGIETVEQLREAIQATLNQGGES